MVSVVQWVVLGTPVLATLVVWQLSRDGVRERTRAQFDRQAQYAADLVGTQMKRYSDALLAGVGFVAGSENVEPEEWREFISRMELEQQFPAISGIGVAFRVDRPDQDAFIRKQRSVRPGFTIRPPIDISAPDAQPYALPLTLIAPQRLEDRAPGLNLMREARRRDAISRASSTGQVQLTAPIRPTRTEDPGFVLIAPIYRSKDPGSAEERSDEFIGAVVASVVTKHLALGILNSDMRQVKLTISDENEVIYNEQVTDDADTDPAPMLTDSRIVPLFGRNWHFEINSTKSFRQAQTNHEPTLILVGGLIIDALLLLLFWHLSRAKKRSQEYGRRISEKYEKQSHDLRQSHAALAERNEELQSFSSVVSHDLKSPLKGIAFLTECIDEDIAEHHAPEKLHPDIQVNVDRIKKQVLLAQGLIGGILSYSGLSEEPDHPQTVDVLELLDSLRTMHAIEFSQLILSGDFPVFVTHQTQLTQVFMNLIGNGFKYHESPADAVVTVRTETVEMEGYYRFSVEDNGPGIDQKYHEKIFDIFATLQPKDHSMSSGVGLAIVKKLVNQHGGHIGIRSAPGEGSRFYFDWPQQLPEHGYLGSTALSKAA